MFIRVALLLIVVAFGAAIYAALPDIIRYLRIRSM
jgi:hypothetical protein